MAHEAVSVVVHAWLRSRLSRTLMRNTSKINVQGLVKVMAGMTCKSIYSQNWFTNYYSLNCNIRHCGLKNPACEGTVSEFEVPVYIISVGNIIISHVHIESTNIYTIDPTYLHTIARVSSGFKCTYGLIHNCCSNNIQPIVLYKHER